MEIVTRNYTKQLNNYGTHTRNDKKYLEGFEES